MTDLAGRLLDLADRVGKLAPDRRDPEHFHIERDEVRKELRRLAGELDPRRAGNAPRGRFNAGAVIIEGRLVRAELRRARRVSTKSSPRRDDAGYPAMEPRWPRKRSSTN